MEVWYLVEDDNSVVLDRITTTSKEAAEKYFTNKGWVIGNVISEGDYIAEMQLNHHENQGY